MRGGNPARHPTPPRVPAMKWDTYLYVPDPDALAAEFADRGAAFSKPLMDTSAGLRGFEITDPDGYALFFCTPGTASKKAASRRNGFPRSRQVRQATGI